MREAPLMWAGRVAIANVGLDGEAIMGARWGKHREKILQQFQGMLETGITLTEEVRGRVRDLVKEAFEGSSASMHGQCTIVWPQGEHPGEALTAWCGDMRVEPLGQLSDMGRAPRRLQRYRVVERMLLLWNEGGAAERGRLYEV